MARTTMTPEEHEQELLARLRSHRKLPVPAERKRIREQARVSLRSLAAAVGCSHVAITRWEAGARPADPAQLERYQRLLDELRRVAEWPADGTPETRAPALAGTRGARGDDARAA